MLEGHEIQVCSRELMGGHLLPTEATWIVQN